MNKTTDGKIFTFYSYKGGTGRTMALANIAWILASRGKRVLVIDWDMEAPGLHRYFTPFLSDPQLSETDGVIEFLGRYVVSVTKEMPEDASSDEKWYRPYADIKRFAEPLQWQFPDGGSIDLVGAGRQNASYGARVNGFNWDGFYQQFGGGAFLDESIQQMKTDYDYVLIDSRTGISDTSGICTIHLPDALVVLYTLNNQSIEGASSVAAHVIANRQRRSEETFHVWSIATRVELAEKEKLEARRLYARERFSPFLETLTEIDNQLIDDYWGEMEVLYDPFYAYDEILATIADLPGRTNSVLAAFERLTARLTNGQISRLGEVSETKRREAMELYSQMGRTRAALNISQKHQPKSWDIFLSASTIDSKQAERLYYLLGTSYKVFHAPKEIVPGDSWKESIMEALEHSRAMLVLFSEESVQRESKWMSAEMQGARRKLDQDPSFRLIPVQLDPNAIPSIDFLDRYQWITAHGEDMQSIAVQIRRSLSTSGSEDNDRDSNVRIRAELEQALEEKASLAARIEMMQNEMKMAQQELKQLSSERAVLIEREANLENKSKELREAKLMEARKSLRKVRILQIMVVILFGALFTLAFIAFPR